MFDPTKHHRRSIRLQNYDYSHEGWYYITICTCGRRCTLGSITDGEVVLSDLGRIVEEQWLMLPSRLPMVELGAYVIMPNHLHGIIMIVHHRSIHGAGAKEETAGNALRPTEPSPDGTQPGSIPAIVQSFKSESTKAARRSCGQADLVLWQRNYYEHIVRGYKSLAAINKYIWENPMHWERDADNPDRVR